MGRISDTLVEISQIIKNDLVLLSSEDKDVRLKALDSLDDVFTQYGFSWSDVSNVLHHFPEYYYKANREPEKPKVQASSSFGKPKEGEWKRARTGSLMGMLAGNSCTVYPSKRGDGTFCTLINLQGDDRPTCSYDFKTEEDAMQYLIQTYSEG